MPSHLVWVDTRHGCTPQALYGDPDKAPFLDEGIRGHVVKTYVLKAHHRELSLKILAELYPAP